MKLSQFMLKVTMASVCLFTFLMTSHAGELNKPTQCPRVAVLKNIHLQESDVIEKEHGRWACCTANGFPYYIDGTWAIHDFVNSYGTNNTWKFNLHDVIANNSSEALVHANADLSTLYFGSGPSYYMGKWSCNYHSSTGGDSNAIFVD